MGVISNITRSSGTDNKAGISRTIYFALAEDVQTWPTLPSGPATYQDLVKNDGAFAMKTGKQFWKFEATVRRSKLTFESAGERGSKSVINRLEVIRATMDDDIFGFFESHKNDDLIFIVKDHEDNLRVLGTEDLPAKIEEFSGDSGADVSDDKHCKFIVESVGDIARVYTGQTIPLTPAA